MKRSKLLAIALPVMFCLLIAWEYAKGEPSGISPFANGNVAITIEAEDGVFQGPIKKAVDGQAFNNLCIYGYHVNRRGWAIYEIDIPVSGNYVIWGRIFGLDQYVNSFFVSVDSDPHMIWDIQKHNRWEWDWISDRGPGGQPNDKADRDPVIFNFSQGKHIIRIGNREKYTRLDRLVITNDLAQIYNAEPDKWIHITAPVFNDVITPGSLFEIKWTSKNISNKVNIDLSLDRGNTYAVPIAHETENDGSFLWQVPAFYKQAKLVIRISDASGAPYDIHFGYFAVVKPGLVTLTLQNPNGGEQIRANTIYVIKWKEYAFNGFVKIYLSIDNGATWTIFAEHQNSSGTNYWNVPNTPFNKCLLKIADAFDDSPFDISDAPFTILPPVAKENAWDLDQAIPVDFKLEQNYPNPFNPQTTVKFAVAKIGIIKLTVYDILGKEVAVLVNENKEPGNYYAQWNASEFASGTYICVLEAGSTTIMRRMTLLK